MKAVKIIDFVGRSFMIAGVILLLLAAFRAVMGDGALARGDAIIGGGFLIVRLALAWTSVLIENRRSAR